MKMLSDHSVNDILKNLITTAYCRALVQYYDPKYMDKEFTDIVDETCRDVTSSFKQKVKERYGSIAERAAFIFINENQDKIVNGVVKLFNIYNDVEGLYKKESYSL